MRVLGCGDMKEKIEGVCFERAAVSKCPLEMDDVCPLLYVLLRCQLWECSNVLPLRLSCFQSATPVPKVKLGALGQPFSGSDVGRVFLPV